MRAIKFRVWSVSKDCKHGTMHYLNDGNMLKDLVEEKGWNVMQYTGLKDKNGKEIFEGDIVQIKHPHKNRKWEGEIVWDKYRFNGKGFGFTHFDYPSELFSEGTAYIEIIGNIYEDSELMEGK